MIHLDIEPVTEGYVEIIDVKSGHRVVAAIEVLSPTNKRPGEGRRLNCGRSERINSPRMSTRSRSTSCRRQAES